MSLVPSGDLPTADGGLGGGCGWKAESSAVGRRLRNHRRTGDDPKRALERDGSPSGDVWVAPTDEDSAPKPRFNDDGAATAAAKLEGRSKGGDDRRDWSGVSGDTAEDGAGPARPAGTTPGDKPRAGCRGGVTTAAVGADAEGSAVMRVDAKEADK